MGESEPSSVIDMYVRARLLREEREARAKRQERRRLIKWSKDGGPVYPGGIDDMDIG